jgi:hypothetical protein
LRLLGLLFDLQPQLLDFVPYLRPKIGVSLDRDGCPVSVCSLRVLLAPVPAHVLCVPFSLSLSLSPTSLALASLAALGASLSLASLSLASLVLASPVPASLSPASLSLTSLSLASLAQASLATLALASLALAALV